MRNYPKKFLKSFMAMIVIVTLFSSFYGTTFAASTKAQTQKPSGGFSVQDPSKVPSIKPKGDNSNAVSNATQDIAIKSTAKSGDATVKASSSSPLPGVFHLNLNVNDQNLRSITLTVNAPSGSILPITSFDGFINVYNYYGTCVSSTHVWASMFYSYSWPLTVPISSTVKEDVMLQGATLSQNFSNYVVPDMVASRYNQIGGAYNSILSAMGGERHHCFASEVYSSVMVTKYNSYHSFLGYVTSTYAPCILMTSEDHQRTASWGSSYAAQAYRSQQLALVQQGKYLAAMQMDINDIHSKFGSRYDAAINQMWLYATATLYWYQ